MLRLPILVAVVSILFGCADAERQNCRENLDYITTERDFTLFALLENATDGDPSNDSAQGILIANFYDLYEKALERERKCDNDPILKLTWPERKDFGSM